MTPWYAFFICVLILIMPGMSAVFAADIPQFSKITDTKGFVSNMKKMTDQNFDRAKGLDGNFQAPVNPVEKEIGVIPQNELKHIVDRGVFSAYASWCGFDWQNKSYLAFMNQERASEKWNDRQLAYMGMLHGISMGYMENQMKKIKGGCKPTDFTKVENYFNTLQAGQ